MSIFSFSPDGHETGVRLDVFLQSRLDGYTRSAVRRALDLRFITVNGKTPKAGYKLTPGDTVLFTEPPLISSDVLPENIPLDILYEDSDVIIVNKPQGMVVHPAHGNYEKTLVNALLFRCGGSLSNSNGQFRPGIVHRIDKDTSGILVAAKNDAAHRHLAAQFHEHTITRKYIAVARGVMEKDAGVIDAPIGRSPYDRKKMAINHKNGKRAVTRYTALERYKRHTLIEASLETGRTHQIRVHMSAAGHPLAGDAVYGKASYPEEPPLQGQALHAAVLGFIHPVTAKYMEFSVLPPEYFTRLTEELRAKSTINYSYYK